MMRVIPGWRADSNNLHIFSDWLVPRLATLGFNFLQLGIVIHSVDIGLPLVWLGGLVLSFEVAILIDRFVNFGTTRLWCAVLVGASTILLVSNNIFPDSFCLPVQCVGVALSALSLKKIRTITDAAGRLKRYWRAYGYVLAGVFNPIIFMFVAFIVVALVLLGTAKNHQEMPHAFFRIDHKNMWAYLCVMLHHWHYFSYAYLVPVVLCNLFGLPTIITGAAFYVGWIGYYLFLKVKRRQALYVSAGHIVASLSVLGLIASNSLPLYLMFWALTGVGGGTIVLLRDATTHGNQELYEHFKTWEAIGHVAGVFCLALGFATEMFYIPLFVAVLTGLGSAGAAQLAVRGYKKDAT
jgi:hypothetical protein